MATIKQITQNFWLSSTYKVSLVAQMVKEAACNVGDLGSIPGLGRFPGGGNGSPLQYSCLENPHGQRRLEATVHGVAESQTRLSN